MTLVHSSPSSLVPFRELSTIRSIKSQNQHHVSMRTKEIRIPDGFRERRFCGRRHFLGAAAATGFLPIDPSYASDFRDVLRRVHPSRPDWYEEFYASVMNTTMKSYEAEWRRKNTRFQVYLQSKGRISVVPRPISFSKSESSNTLPIQSSLGYDPSDELFGVDFSPRETGSDLQEPRSWFGPNGQYIRELPCPSCRGRGYTPCTECGIERSRQECPLCSGKGTMTCRRCSGECVVWEESIDEQPWEKAQSISPFRMKEDDEVDNLEIKFAAKRKSKRIYQSPPPEVGQKISRSLKSLNAKTGLFSKRMKIIHRNPTLQAQRIAAIKKAKGTAAARKLASESMKAFFSDPENRRKRSFAMKGVKFFCKNCGQEGHRRHYCPNLKSSVDRRFKCRICGGKGHNRRTCPKSNQTITEVTIRSDHRCRLCSSTGHNKRTCPRLIVKGTVRIKDGETDEKGDNRRTSLNCTSAVTERTTRRHHHCRICGFSGHNRRTCSK